LLVFSNLSKLQQTCPACLLVVVSAYTTAVPGNNCLF
jgi:hypothetical protein